MKIKLPNEVYEIITKLNTHGCKAYAVGGCIRDSLMNRLPKDWDITTDAMPEAVQSIFDKTIPTGIKHGTITVLLNDNCFEVTTFRVDGVYSDNRRPDSVEFTTSIEDDLSRRDFTMNAIAYSPDTGIVDPFSGMKDIELGIIRAVGTADKRFKEDALRMLRAIRFSSQLKFEVESATLHSIKDNNELIKNISVERIRDELNKILISDNPMNFVLLKETKILRHIIPEFDECFGVAQNNPYHISNVAMHSLNSVSKVDRDLTLRWTMLLHDIGKYDARFTDHSGIDHFYGHERISAVKAENILKRLRLDTNTINKVCTLITHHDKQIKSSSKAVRRMLNAIGAESFEALIKVKKADILAQNLLYAEERLVTLDKINAVYSIIQEEMPCISLKNLAVKGTDLLEMGIPAGRQIGIILNKLLNLVIDDPLLNDRDTLLNIVNNINLD